LPSLLLKIEGGGETVLPPFLSLNLRKFFFYFSMEAYIVHLAKGIRIFGQGYVAREKKKVSCQNHENINNFLMNIIT
jgi:hypothetical protein